MKLGYLIDGIVSKFGLRFVCFSAYKNPPPDLEHIKSNIPLLHLPDRWGFLQCAYCGRLKRLHFARNIKL